MSTILWLLGLGLAGFVGWTLLRGAPYVPTHKKQLQRVFDELIDIDDGDTLVDLGAGDGIVLKLAAEQGAKAIGYEINPLLVVLMRLRFLRQANISVQYKDYLLLDSLPKSTTVVYAFATSRDIKKIDQKMKQWSSNKSLMLVSYGFSISSKKPIKTLAPFELYRYG